MENNAWKCILLNFCKIKTVDEVGVDEMGSGNKPFTLTTVLPVLGPHSPVPSPLPILS